jgi:predicted RNA-binding Zn-ribbon protein involved in translation (DUF1610 family)
VEFVCKHCGSKSLWLVAVDGKNVKVECLSCGKQSVINRAAAPRPLTKPPTQS